MAESQHLPAPPEPSADRVQLYDIMTRAGLDGRDATAFTQLVEEMASANLIHRFESKLEAQNAKLDAQNTKFNLLLWFIGIATAILSIAITLS